MFYKRINRHEVAGRFNNVIYLVEKVVNINANGFKEETYTDVKTIRANVFSVAIKEFFANDNLNLRTLKRVQLRYDSVVNHNSTIKYKNRLYNVIEIIEVDEKEHLLELVIELIEDGE